MSELGSSSSGIASITRLDSPNRVESYFAKLAAAVLNHPACQDVDCIGFSTVNESETGRSLAAGGASIGMFLE